MPQPGNGTPCPVTLIPGDGVGPLVTGAVDQVMEAMHAPVYFEKYDVHGDMKTVSPELIESIKKNKVCLKGGLKTPVGGGVSSLNVLLRKELDLYPSLVHCFNLQGASHSPPERVVESLKVITKLCSERIAKYVFEYAYLNNRKKVTVVHKANIMKLADGLFLESCREIASTSKYLTVGIAGGTGVTPGGNVGADHAIFKQGASAAEDERMKRMRMLDYSSSKRSRTIPPRGRRSLNQEGGVANVCAAEGESPHAL
ncbi:hypothetical protein SASPL_133678 [Salvia splendens]|uniref:Isopropylmalate dehydrogenase-like domain-containing protein n=1 Tax=Salvia splendens TaxID=180675 RepID=A0A8X8X631_SALSN|nr:hypothetical protein SASPL_133678 [Salvia splendens]